MGDVVYHAKSSARKFGGKAEDYTDIHAFLDQSKLYLADWRHRALLHSTFGIALCERFFGHAITNSDGEMVSVRTIASQHIMEDIAVIPAASDWLQELPLNYVEIAVRAYTLEQERVDSDTGP